MELKLAEPNSSYHGVVVEVCSGVSGGGPPGQAEREREGTLISLILSPRSLLGVVTRDTRSPSKPPS